MTCNSNHASRNQTELDAILDQKIRRYVKVVSVSWVLATVLLFLSQDHILTTAIYSFFLSVLSVGFLRFLTQEALREFLREEYGRAITIDDIDCEVKCRQKKHWSFSFYSQVSKMNVRLLIFVVSALLIFGLWVT